MSPEYIAQRFDSSARSVSYYGKICFDVDERLDDADFILGIAIASERRLGDPATAQRRATMKLMAYLCGPQALDDLFGGASPQQPRWTDPLKLLDQQSTLLQLDQAAELLLGGASPGKPLSPEAFDQYKQAVAPYIKGDYLPRKDEWLLRAGCKSASHATPSKKRKPLTTVLHDSNHPPSPSTIKRPAPLPTVPYPRHALMKSFASVLTPWNESEPDAPNGSGISSDWNKSIFRASARAAGWARKQIREQDSALLLDSGLFAHHEGSLQLVPELSDPDTPLVALRLSPASPPLRVYAGEWPLDQNLAEYFLVDAETRRLADDHGGAFVAANSVREVIAWRRLRIPAIPIPPMRLMATLAKDFWSKLWFIERRWFAYKGEFSGVRRPPSNDLLQSTLVIPTFDPVSLNPLSPNDYNSRASALINSSRFESYDFSGLIGMWEAPKELRTQLHAAIVKGTPEQVYHVLFSSLRQDLYFFNSGRRIDKPPADLATLRNALTTIDSSTSIEQCDELRHHYLRQFDVDVVNPMVREALKMDSTEQRILATAQAGLVQIFAELQTDMTLAAAVGNADPKRKSARVRDICHVTKEIRSLIRSGKEESRGRRH